MQKYERITLEEFKDQLRDLASPNGRMPRTCYDELLSAAGRNMFEYNRFNKEIMIAELNKAKIDVTRGVVNIETRDFLLYDQWPDEDTEMEIHFTEHSETEKLCDEEYYRVVIAEALMNLPDFDNLIQQELEESYVNSKHHVSNYLYSPYWMQVSEKDILVAYGGCEINNEFHVFFIKKDDKWIRDFSRRW